MRDTIWYEMTDIKVGELYLSLYLNRAKTVKKWFIGFNIVFSSTGVFGWKFWEYYAQMVCGVIAALQILSILTDKIVRSDDDLMKIAKLRGHYTKYMLELESLWFRLENNNTPEGELSLEFLEVRSESIQKIQDLDNKLHINGKLKGLYKEAEEEANKYLINRYGKTTSNITEVTAQRNSKGD